jgi:hypothetical protein
MVLDHEPLVVPRTISTGKIRWQLPPSRRLHQPHFIKKDHFCKCMLTSTNTNSLVILVSWELWKHLNACVLEGNRPNVQAVPLSVSGEGRMWCLAGASRLQELIPRPALPLPI